MTRALAKNSRRLPSTATLIAHLQAGLTPAEIGGLYGCQPSTVTQRLNREGLSLVDLKNWKRTRADLLSFKQMQILEAMSREKMLGASLRDQATALASLSNAERLERGQSTANVDINEVSTRLADLTATENALRRKMGLPEIPETLTEGGE